MTSRLWGVGKNGLWAGFPAGGVPSFDPMIMTPNMWIDTSDMATLFQDSARTTPVATAADPIGGVADKSGSARHLLQATGAARPAFRQTAGKNAWENDGVDDVLQTAAGQTWPASVDVFFVVSNAINDTLFVLANNGAADPYLAIGISGDANTEVSQGLLPTYVNNALVANRGAMYSALAGGTLKVVELRAVSIAGIDKMAFGAYSGAHFTGRFHEVLICPAQAAGVRTQYREHLTAKWGVS